MSCLYFKIKEPFTEIKLRDLPEEGSSEISAYIGDKVVEQIVVPKEDEYATLRKKFFYDRVPALITSSKPCGALSLYRHLAVLPEQQLLSDYGDLVTAEEVFKMVEESQKK